jgi:hypothetical protein
MHALQPSNLHAAPDAGGGEAAARRRDARGEPAEARRRVH